MSASSPAPLRLVIPDRVRKQLAAATVWLRSLPFGGDGAAERFSLTVDRELPMLCADLAERLATGSNLPRIDEEASLAFSRPAYRHTFTTATGGKRRRNQTAGVWYVFYELPNPQTVQLLFVRHSAGEPLTADFDRPFDATGDANTSDADA